MPVVAAEWQHQVATGEILGDEPRNFCIDFQVLQICHRNLKMRTEHHGHVVLVDGPLVYQHGPQGRVSQALRI